jgi:hypothetical protein
MLILYVLDVHEEAPEEDSLSGGAAPDGKIPLPLMTKGERFIRCRGQRHGSRWIRFIRCRGKRHGFRGSMTDMISVLHQSVAINAKGGDC